MTREERRTESEADAQEQKEGRKLIADAMRMILQDSTAAKAEIIFAPCVLDSLLYLHAIPYRLSIPGSAGANIDDFAKNPFLPEKRAPSVHQMYRGSPTNGGEIYKQ